MTRWTGPDGERSTWGGPDDPHLGRCCATSKTTGGRCEAHAAKGARTCARNHGGGLAGRPPKHGRFAFKSQGELSAAYNRWLPEAEALDLTDHLAALAATAQRCITRCEDLDTPGFRKIALALYREATAGKEERQAVALSELGELLHRGAEEDDALRTLAGTLVDFGKRMEAAKTLDLQEQHTVTMRTVETLVGGILSILMQHGETGETVARQLDRDVFRRNGIRVAG